MKPYAYSLRPNAHVSFPCYFNSWILIWVLFGTQINIHVVGALTHKILQRQGARSWCKVSPRILQGFHFWFDVVAACLIAINHCPVIIAKQAYSDMTLNMHSQFSILFCFSFCFCLFCLGHFDFVRLFSFFWEQKNLRFSMPVKKCDFNRESRTNLDYYRPSSETELRLIFLQYCDLPPLITVEDRQLGVSRSLCFQITKIVAIKKKNKKKKPFYYRLHVLNIN